MTSGPAGVEDVRETQTTRSARLQLSRPDVVMTKRGLDSSAESTGSDLPSVASPLPDSPACDDDGSFSLCSLLQEPY